MNPHMNIDDCKTISQWSGKYRSEWPNFDNHV